MDEFNPTQHFTINSHDVPDEDLDELEEEDLFYDEDDPELEDVEEEVDDLDVYDVFLDEDEDFIEDEGYDIEEDDDEYDLYEDDDLYDDDEDEDDEPYYDDMR